MGLMDKIKTVVSIAQPEIGVALAAKGQMDKKKKAQQALAEKKKQDAKAKKSNAKKEKLKALRENKQKSQDAAGEKQQTYKDQWGRGKVGRKYRAGQKADVKSSLKQQKLDAKANKKQARLQEKSELGPFKYFLKHKGPWILILLIIAYLIFLAVQYDVFKTAEEKNIVGSAEDALDNSGISHQFDVVKQVLGGTYDPDELWESNIVESEYSSADQFEILIFDIGPRQEFYRSDSDLYIGGSISLVSGFDDNTIIKLSVEPKDFCAASTSATVSDKLEIVDPLLNLGERVGIIEDELGCSDGSDWECSIQGSESLNEFQMDRTYNREFNCKHTGVIVDEEHVISDLDITWSYSAKGVAGKQVYVFNSETLDKFSDPIRHYEIDKDSLVSWYLGDDQINLGLGFDDERDAVRADSGADLFKPINVMGVTVNNIGTGKVVNVKSLTVSFPNNEFIQVADESLDGYTSDFEGPYDGVINIRGQDVQIKEYKLFESRIDDFEFLDGAEYSTYYLPFIVDEEYIGESAFRSFLVKVDIDYEYQDSESTSITVKP